MASEFLKRMAQQERAKTGSQNMTLWEAPAASTASTSKAAAGSTKPNLPAIENAQAGTDAAKASAGESVAINTQTEQPAKSDVKASDFLLRKVQEEQKRKDLNEKISALETLRDKLRNETEYDWTDTRQRQAVTARLEEYDAQIEAAKAEKWYYEKGLKYAALSENRDYAELSKKVAEKQTAGLGIGIDTYWWGQGDPLYDYINNIEGARGKLFTANNADQFLRYATMTDKEIGNYNYLYNTGGQDAAKEYLDYLEADLSQRLQNIGAEKTQALAQNAPGLASLLSVPATLLSGVGTLDIAAQNLDKKIRESVTGEYAGPVNYGSNATTLSRFSTNVRETVSQKITDETGVIQLDTEKHPILSRILNGKGLADVYQLGMSMVDSAAVAGMTALTGVNMTALLGGSASTQTILDSVEKGATDEQALTMGMLSGAFEIIFEKYELENLLGADTNMLKAMANQALTEGIGEGATSVANILADTFVMAESSDWQKNVRAYMAQGLTESEARKQAFLDAVIQIGWDAVGGMAMGGISGGGASAVNNMNDAVQKNTQKNALYSAAYGSDVEALINEALELNPDNTLAKRLKKAVESGKTVSGRDIRRLVEANEAEIRKQQETTAETDAVEEELRQPEQEEVSEESEFTLQKEIERQWDSRYEQDSPVQSAPEAAQDIQNDQNTGVAENEEPLSVAARLRQQEEKNGGAQHVSENEQAQRIIPSDAGAGASVSYGSSQRYAGQSTGEQAGVLAGGTEQRRNTGADRSRAAVARQNLARSLRLEKVSSLDLGLQNGTESRNIQVMPQEHWDDEMAQLADRIYEETGKDVTYVVGRIQIRSSSGAVAYVRGVITGNRIIVQADNFGISMEQLADHEVYHDKVDKYEQGNLNDEIRRHIVRTFSEEQFQKVLEKYIVGLSGVIDVNAARTVEEYEAALRQIEEEIFADAYAGINAFGANADQFTEAVNEKMEQLGMGKLKKQENGVRETGGPPVVQKENTAESGGERYSSVDDQNSAENYLESANMTLQEYTDGESVAEFILAVSTMIDQSKHSKRKKRIGVVSQKHADLINGLMQKIKPGFSTDGYELWIDGTGASHIEKRHGANGKADHSMATKEAKMLIPWASQNADACEFILTPNGDIKRSYRFKNSDGTSPPEISMEKSLGDDTVYVSECVPDSANKRIWITSAYIKKGSTGQMLDMEESSPQRTPEAPFDGSATTDIVATPGRTVKERFSVDDSEREQKQTKQTTKPVAESRPLIAKKDLRNTMLNLFSVPDGSRAELGVMIDSYADRLIKNGILTEEDRKAFFDRMYDSGVMTVPANDYYAEARSYLKDSRIYVPDSIVADFGDDWSDIRRRAFASGIYLTRSRTHGGHSVAGIDVWNGDLASELPGLFNAEETDQRTILERIVQVAEEGKDENMSLAEYTARLAEREHQSEAEFLDNMERQMDWALRTFAEKARLEVHLRDRTGRKIAQERQKHQESAQLARDRKELRELQEKTLKQLQWLSKNRNRAPEELKATWDEVLGDIDLYAIGAANEMRWSDKYNASWKDLAQMYKDAMKNDPNFMPSKELERIVARLDGSKIADMDIGALQDLYKAAIGLRTEFYNRNKVVGDEMQRLFAEVYTDVKKEIESAPGGFTGNVADKFLNMDQLTPMNVLQRMAGWDPNSYFLSMAKQLERGERDMRAYHVKAQKMLQEFLTEHEDWVKIADGQGKDAIWYEVEVPQLLELHMGDKPIFGPTVKVYMTPAQKVHMYLESKNLDNLRHMTGGRTFVDKELYSKGKRQEALAQGRTIRLAPETVRKLVSDLTAEEMELAQLLDRYYNTFATQEINKVSNILYGYDKAMGKNYAPIYTNRNYTKTEFGVFDTTAEGVGNLKGRQYAVNPSYNISAFDAFERHVDQTARFVGMAIPARNWTTLMNWREKNNSMGDVITHRWGEEGKRYITDLITTLQAGDDAKSDTVSSGLSKLQSNYITAIFGANPSIVLKQLGSIPLAGAYLGARNIPTPAQISKIDRSLISKYTQELEWRTMGYTTPETKQLKDNPNWTQTNKTFKFVFGGGAITAMDGWAASTLWPWAENKVRREHPDLEVGTQAQVDAGESPFYKKVAEEFENALSRSQSVSDEIHQGRLRKSKNPLTRTFTMFRSDSAQTYNTLRQKIGEARYYMRTGAKDKVIRTAKKAVGTAFMAMLINAAWGEAINFLMALWKNKGKYYRDDEDELTFESVAGEMVSGMLGSFAGVVTGGEEVLEIIGNILTGEKIYDIETPGMEQLNDLIDTVTTAGGDMRDLAAGGWDILKNGGDLGEYYRRNSGKILGSIKDLAVAAATYLPGLPASNLEAYLVGAVKWLSPELGTAYDDLFSNVGKADLSGLEGGALKSRIGGILSDRRVSESDETAEALAGLYEAGYKEAIPSDTPTSVTIDGEKQTMGEYQQQAYNTIWGEIVADALDGLVSSDGFASADPKTQEKMLNYLYTYAGEMAKAELFDGYEPDTRDEAVAAFADAGLTMEDFLYAYGKYSEIYNMDGNATAKATEFAHWLSSQDFTADQAAIIKDELVYYNMSPATSSKYDKWVDAGMDPDDAHELAGEMGELEPMEGEDEVLDVQRWRTCVDFSGNEGIQLAGLAGQMSASQFAKVQIAHDFGVTPDAYVGYYEIREKFDADQNKSYSNAEVQAAIDAMKSYGLTNAEKAVLWQLATGSKSAKNNPYSTEVGEKVLAAKQAASE